MNRLRILLRTLRAEGFIALVTGITAFGLTWLMAPSAMGTAAAFGVVAGVSAAVLDTVYFHLLFLLQGTRLHAAETRYAREMEEARRRLRDGSLRLREALILRFEEDHRRSVTTRSRAESKRQLREARQRFKARHWALRRLVTGEELTAATTEAKDDPELLDHWTERIDGLVDARTEVRRRGNLGSNLLSWLWPARLDRQTIQERGNLGVIATTGATAADVETVGK